MVAGVIYGASLTLFSLVACADDEPKDETPRELPLNAIETVLLKDVDKSHEIKHPSLTSNATAESRALKPRIVPDYDQLRSAIWRGSANVVSALIGDGADPNEIGEDG